jgi:N-acyl-D-amino-acid deacylase
LNPLLIWTMGFAAAKSGRMPTDAEHAQMARLLHEAMDAGACGWSAQCLGTAGRPDLPTLGGTAQVDFDGTPMPSDVMWPETRAVLAKALGDRGEGFIALSMGLSNPDEWEKLATISQAPLLWQALPPGGDERGTKMRRHLLRWLASCQQRGLRIYAQGITQDPALVFTFDYFDLWGEVWGEYVGPTLSTAERVANLRDSSVREKLRAAPLKYPFIASIPDTVLKRTETAQFKPFADQRIGQIAETLGMHPVDVVCEMVAADGLRSVFETRQFDTTLEGLRELIDAPYVIPGLSDGGAHLKYLTAGSFGTEYISKYVRDHGFTTLEEAHWRLSALPAFCAGFRDRGVLREGAAADIIVYDLDRLDTTYPEFVRDLPGDEYRVMNRGHGYRHVLVNGGITIENDAPTHCHSGALLRRGGARG